MIAFRENRFANPEGLIGFIQKEARTVSLRPDHTLLCRRTWDRAADRLDGAATLAAALAGIAASKSRD